MTERDDPGVERDEGGVPPPAKLPDVESPPKEEVLEGSPDTAEVVENAQPAEEIIEGQPSVDELLGRDD